MAFVETQEQKLTLDSSRSFASDRRFCSNNSGRDTDKVTAE